MNDLLLTQLFLALIVWLPLCAVALAPLAILLSATRRTIPRVGAILVAYYLLLTAVTGLYAYVLVPADYTRDHRPTCAPAANPCNEQHRVALQYAAATTLTAEQREGIRAQVAAERAAFGDEWLMLTGRGLITPMLLLLGWISWQRRPHTSEARR